MLATMRLAFDGLNDVSRSRCPRHSRLAAVAAAVAGAWLWRTLSAPLLCALSSRRCLCVLGAWAVQNPVVVDAEARLRLMPRPAVAPSAAAVLAVGGDGGGGGAAVTVVDVDAAVVAGGAGDDADDARGGGVADDDALAAAAQASVSVVIDPYSTNVVLVGDDGDDGMRVDDADESGFGGEAEDAVAVSSSDEEEVLDEGQL